MNISIDPGVTSQPFVAEKAESSIKRRALTKAGVLLLLILAVAFLLRFTIRVSYGEEYFWKNSYSLFYDLAQNVAAGRGLCYEWIGWKCAHRPPVYPLFLVLTMIGGKNYLLIVFLQSLLGAGTALCAFLIGRQLFDTATGLLAAFGVAFYPYFVMHDTALQETGLFTFLTALSIYLLLKSRRSQSKLVWMLAGITLALAVLTRATLSVFVPFVFLWLLLFSGSMRRERLRKTALVVAGFMLMLAPWLIRNYVVVGKPTMSTLSGLTLWAGNNPYTFANYPDESIDLSVNRAWSELNPKEIDTIHILSIDELAQNSWFIDKALAYIKSHPAETLTRAFRKVGAAFSWRQNPGRERFVQTVYFLSYFPALLLGLAGALLASRRWREHSLIYALFLAFIAVTAIFFAHTSHRSFLDVYLIVFSAYSLMTVYRLITKRKEQIRPAQS